LFIYKVYPNYTLVGPKGFEMINIQCINLDSYRTLICESVRQGIIVSPSLLLSLDIVMDDQCGLSDELTLTASQMLEPASSPVAERPASDRDNDI
jgi:hypothetical protein